MRDRTHLHAAHRGFSIVEAMVALLVLSVGMLGIAGLYVTTLRASGSALYRTHAVNLAADMADRIRANPNGALAYEGAPAGSVQCDDGAVPCNPAQIAADDLLTWSQEIATLLPDDDGDPDTAQGLVAVDDTTNPNTYQISVSWAEPTEPQPLTYVLRMQI